MDRKVKVLRHHTIPYVKIQWINHIERKATWKDEIFKKREECKAQQLGPVFGLFPKERRPKGMSLFWENKGILCFT